MVVADTGVPLFRDRFWHFQIKIKFGLKISRQDSIQLLDADFFWIIPWSEGNTTIAEPNLDLLTLTKIKYRTISRYPFKTTEKIGAPNLEVEATEELKTLCTLNLLNMIVFSGHGF